MNKLVALLLLISLAMSCGQKRKPKPKNIIILNNPKNHTELFEPGIVSSHLHERDMAIHPNGKLIVFSRGGLDQKQRVLVQIRIFGDSAGVGIQLPFANIEDHIEPFFHPNGTELYFASNRAYPGRLTSKDYNIWKVSYDETTHQWGEPVPLPDIINSESDEFFPAVSEKGTLFFTATYKNGVGKEDIYESRLNDGNYSSPVPLSKAINSETYEFNAYVSPNEDVIIFSSYGRKDDLGGGDLYMSTKLSSGDWKPAIHLLEGINSKFLDYCPFVDWERQTFYFTSNRKKSKTSDRVLLQDIQVNAVSPENGIGDIYRIHTDKLKELMK